jgi:hypothetical protein
MESRQSAAARRSDVKDHISEQLHYLLSITPPISVSNSTRKMFSRVFKSAAFRSAKNFTQKVTQKTQKRAFSGHSANDPPLTGFEVRDFSSRNISTHISIDLYFLL